MAADKAVTTVTSLEFCMTIWHKNKYFMPSWGDSTRVRQAGGEYTRLPGMMFIPTEELIAWRLTKS